MLRAMKKVDPEKVMRGKRNKRKGASFENDIAKKLSEFFGVELKRTPQSGGFAKARKMKILDMFLGDIVPITEGISLAIHIECKNQRSPLFNRWFKQAQDDCAKGKIPVVIWHRQQVKEPDLEKQKIKVVEKSEDFIFMKFDDFCKLVDKDKVVIEDE